MIKATIISLLFFIPTLAAYCNDTDYYFKQITIGNGLSQASVTSILFDHKGTLWIGTKSGVNTYNSYELKTYFNEKENKYSLPGNHIQFIAEDSTQNIWISTNRGLVKHDPENDQFDFIVRERTYSFLNIPGGILFGGNKKLYKYDYHEKSIKRIPFPDQGKATDPSDYNIIKMIELEEGKALIGTKNKGIYIYDYSSHNFKTFFSGTHNILLSLCIGPDSLIYESSYGQGIYCYNRKGHLVANYALHNSGLKNNIVLDMLEKDGKIWMGTDGDGINIFDPSTSQFTELRHIPGDANSLPVNSITILYKDCKDNFWAGSVRGGIFSIKETFIRTYTDVALNNTYGLSEKAIISIYEEDNGQVWIGTDGGGINLYNPHTDHFTHFSSTYSDKVVSITGLSENELLVSLYSKGLFVFNKRTGQYRPFTIVNASINIQECFYGFTPQAHKVADNKIYILSLTPRIYHPNSKTFSDIKVAPGISPEAFLLAYSNDSLSYFMKENQVFKVDQSNDSLHVLFSIEEADNIHSVCYDNKNTLWIGTDQGLGYYDITQKQYKPIPTKLFNNVSYLFLDNKGKLWICAQNMLFSYIIKENKFIVWSESDGFAPNEILFMYQNPIKNKYIYLGGTDGFVKINPNISYDGSQSPRVELANIIFNGSSYISKIKDNTIKIPWDYNSLTVAVRVNEKDIFRKTLFRFTIVGMGRQQIESYSPQLNLASLLPGTYSLLVSCNTKNGNYTPTLQLLEITITPPWYKSGWFVSGCFLLLSAIIIAVIYLILKKKANRLKREMKEYEQTVNKEKIDFLINVSHELRTPLTLIYAPLKRLIDKSQDDFSPTFVKNQLYTIYKQARQMKNIINMVLDLNRLNVGPEALNKQPHQLNNWIRNITEDFNTEWEEKDIEVKFQMDEKIGFIWFDEWKCQIILSNLLMNALKFSEPHSQITLSTTLIEKKARVSVTDEGIGLRNVDTSRLFSRFYQGKHNQTGSGIGLSYAKMLIEAHGGNIDAFENPEKGATFYFELPVAEQESIPPIPEQTADYDTTSEIPALPVSISYADYSILIVEDEADLKNFLEEALKEKFKSVYTAEDGIQALEICRNNQPDIIVSDIMMPRMDGYELCKRIKNDIEVSHIPVILLTARADQNSIMKGYKQGADFYIPKPFDTDFLLTIIGKLLLFKETILQKYKTGTSQPSPQEATISKSDENFLTKFNDIVNQNLSNPELSIKFLTAAMSMSRSSLYSKVKVLTGLGINDYINRLRIEKAVELLRHSDLNINEISDEVGFTYPRYFSTLFKQMKGITPTQYKENCTLIRSEESFKTIPPPK